MAKLIKKNLLLQEAIDRRGLKQIWIAERAGVDASTFSKILNGIQNPTPEQIRAIADAMGMPVDDLF
jgi:transcriptional regulator with XRE-family HTH domain